MKKRLLNGEMIDFTNGVDSFTLWFEPKTNNFCLEQNAKVIKATKTFKPIQNKLDGIRNLVEL